MAEASLTAGAGSVKISAEGKEFQRLSRDLSPVDLVHNIPERSPTERFRESQITQQASIHALSLYGEPNNPCLGQVSPAGFKQAWTERYARELDSR